MANRLSPFGCGPPTLLGRCNSPMASGSICSQAAPAQPGQHMHTASSSGPAHVPARPPTRPSACLPACLPYHI